MKMSREQYKSCHLKRAYRTVDEAQRMVDRARVGHYPRFPVKLRIYQCKYCHCFHLTSKDIVKGYQR
jgi:hypothetical protein